MNNGDGQSNPNFPINDLSLTGPNPVVNHERYSNDMQRLQSLKTYLAAYEEKLSEGYARFRDLEERQRLEETVRQGELAARLLAEMQSGKAASAAQTPASAGPSNAAQPSTLTSVYPAQGDASYNEVPSSAKIVEVPPSQESPKPTRTSARLSAKAEAKAASSQPEVPQAAPSRPRVPQAAQSRPRPPQAAQNRPRPPQTAQSRPRVPVASYNVPQGYTNTSQPFQDWTAFGASPSVMYGFVPTPGAHAQHSAYQTAQWSASQAPQYQYRPYYPGVQAQAPSHAASTSRSAPQPYYAGSQQADRPPQQEHTASGSSQPVGAPSASSSTQARVDGTSRSNVAQSSESGPSQPFAPGQTQQPRSISHDQQQQLFQFLQRYPLPEAQILMQQILRVMRCRQTKHKTFADIEFERKLAASVVKTADLVADYLKVYPDSEVRDVFKKYIILAGRQQQAAALPDGRNGSNAAPQHPQQPVPSVSTSTPQSAPPSHPNGGNAGPPATIQLPVPQPIVRPSSSAAVVAAPGPSTAVPTPTASATAASSTSNANSVGSSYSQISWYTPRDPTAPIMVRNAKGQIQWLHRQSLPQSAAPPAPAQPQVPSTPPAPKAAPQPEVPATPQPRPASGTAAWTPERADRSRLAQDIMRSLGRPKGAFGTPLSPTNSSPALPFEVIHPPTVTSTPIPAPTAAAAAKRKASLTTSSPVSPTTVKRPRLDEQQDEQDLIVDVTTIEPPEAVVVEEVAPGVDGEHEVEAPAVVAAPESIVEGETQEEEDMDHVDAATLPLADGNVDVTGHALLPGLDDADTMRAISVTSSEAANIDRVLDVTVPEPEPEPETEPEPVTDGVPSRDVRESSADLAPPAYLDRGGQGPDGALHATSSPLQELSAAASNATPPPSSPVPDRGKGKEKVPLFLPSPSGSPEPSVPSEDEDAQSDASAAPRLPGGRKGKGRALDADLELLQLVDDEGEASETSSAAVPRKRRRTNRAYVLAPPLPEYAASLRGNEIVWWGSRSPSSVASGSRYGSPSVSGSAIAGEDDEVDDELPDWRADEEVGPVAASEPDVDGEEAEAAAELAFSRVKETPCHWDGCDAVLNSSTTLQRHVERHAGENSEWGTFTCQWKGCLSNSFKDEQSLARHLQKHARSPLWCAYEGCDRSFASASDLLHHHQSGKHQDGQLRKSCYPAPPPENRRQLSPLPDVLPAYMLAVNPVRRHPISRDRHQWVGPKVLENITSFKYTGRRSHAGQPSRLSRRLAEKVVAVELASVTPESGHAQIRRWIDDEYLDFADGYDASRRHRLWCADIPAGEVTQMVHDGLALFVDAGAGGEEGDRSADGGLGGDGSGQAPDLDAEDGDGLGGGEGTAAAAAEGSREDSPAGTSAEGRKPTVRLKLTLPRRSNVIRLPARPNRTEADPHRDGDADAVAGNANTSALPNPGRLDGSKTPPPAATATQSPLRPTPTSTPQLPEAAGTGAPSPQLVSVPEPSTGEVLGSVWTVWPPAKEESVETH